MSDLEELANVFRSEATERLNELGEALRAQSSSPQDEGALDSARRAAHNLKGAALTVGARPIAAICEVLEHEIQVVNESGTAPSTEQIATWLYLVTEIQGIVANPNIVQIQVADSPAFSTPAEDGLYNASVAGHVPPSRADAALSVAALSRNELAARVEQAVLIRQRMMEQVQAIQTFYDAGAQASPSSGAQLANGLPYHVVGLREAIEGLGVVLGELAELLK